jgi:hypothetical protein
MTEYEAFIVYSDFVKNRLIEQLARYDLPDLAIHIVNPPVDMLDVDSSAPRSGIILQPEPGLSEMGERVPIRAEDFSKESFAMCWQNLLH